MTVLNDAGNDILERRQTVHHGGIAKTVVGKYGGEIRRLIMQRHVIQDDRLDQQVDLQGGRRGSGRDRGIGTQPADLLVLGLLGGSRAQQLRAATRVIHQNERGRGR